jgi:chemotaxis-related protein WspB
MLALTFNIGKDRLALDSRHVHEVVPSVPLQPLTGGPPWLAGAFVYRGHVVPVLDLHRLAGAGECPAYLSSRIILVNAASQGQLVGLLAAQVADLRELQAPNTPLAGLVEPGRPNFGPLVADGSELLRLLDLDHFLPTTMSRQLLAASGDIPA